MSRRWTARSRAAMAADRWSAWRAGRAVQPAALITRPSPYALGDAARGEEILSGQLVLAGHELNIAPGEDLPWSDPPNEAVAQALHGFGWLDHLAALGDARARACASAAITGWIGRYGPGQAVGPAAAWAPAVAGRRLWRWITHAPMVLRAQSPEMVAGFQRSLAHQARFLAARAASAPPGLPRFEALSALALAGATLEGGAPHLPAALAALSTECGRAIGPDGSIATRNPEDLLDIFCLLVWLRESGAMPAAGSPPIDAALARMAPTLRALRHGDGALARFHGGGAGQSGRLDEALALAGRRDRPGPERHMGYARLAARRLCLIADAAPPPMGPGSRLAHASTLGVEFSVAGQRIVVSCGPGAALSQNWQRAARNTASHSALVLNQTNSALLGPERQVNGLALQRLIRGPRDVSCDWSETDDALRLEMQHDGYRAETGLLHTRHLELPRDGAGLWGEDTLRAATAPDRKRRDAAAPGPMRFDLRFHLHPDIVAVADGAGPVTLALPSGDYWVFQHEGAETLALEPSVYLQSGTLRPRDAQQIVLTGRVMDYAGGIRWAFMKADATQQPPRAPGLPPDDAPPNEESP